MGLPEAFLRADDAAMRQRHQCLDVVHRIGMRQRMREESRVRGLAQVG